MSTVRVNVTQQAAKVVRVKAVGAQGPPGGGSDWGTITGTLSNQTDLQSALDAKVAKSTYDANTVLAATDDNTPIAVTIAEQTVLGRTTGGAIAALSIDSDLTSVSTNDDTIPSAKATKAALDGKQAANANLVTAAGTLTDTRLIRGSGSKGIEESGIVIGDDDAVSGAGTKIIDAADSRNFAATDIGCTVRMTGSGKTLTMPAQSGDGSVFAVNDFINILHDGASTLTIAVTTDTLVSDGSKTKIKLACPATLVKVASARWALIGTLE